MRGGVRAGSLVRSGPSGSPPPGARICEVGSVSPLGVLVRFEGAQYFDRVASAGWRCLGATEWDWARDASLAGAASTIYLVANDFDPTVSVLAVPVGSIARRVSSPYAWLRYGTGDYDWRSLNEARATVTASGGPLAALDLSIVVPSDSSLSIRARLASTKETQANLTLRANGAGWVGIWKKLSWKTSGSTYVDAATADMHVGYIVGTGVGGPAVKFRVAVDVGPIIDGLRSVEVKTITADQNSNSYNSLTFATTTVGNLSSVGLAMDGNYIVDGGIMVGRSAQGFWS